MIRMIKYVIIRAIIYSAIFFFMHEYAFKYIKHFLR